MTPLFIMCGLRLSLNGNNCKPPCSLHFLCKPYVLRVRAEHHFICIELMRTDTQLCVASALLRNTGFNLVVVVGKGCFVNCESEWLVDRWHHSPAQWMIRWWPTTPRSSTSSTKMQEIKLNLNEVHRKPGLELKPFMHMDGMDVWVEALIKRLP